MFNIRVYGLLLKENNILLCEEFIRGKKIIKFPGGGLEFGEGMIDCLKREFMEELGIDIHDLKHFYTTDFFVRSAIIETEQVISIYYLVNYPDAIDLAAHSNEEIIFFWKALNAISEDDVSLPIDKVVMRKLATGY